MTQKVLPNNPLVALMLDLRTDFILPCKLIAYDQLLSLIYLIQMLANFSSISH